MNLSQLPIGATSRIKAFPATGPAFLRLREMGVLPGTQVKLVRVAPLGDPIEIKVRGYSLSLRKSEAEHVEIEALPTTAST